MLIGVDNPGFQSRVCSIYYLWHNILPCVLMLLKESIDMEINASIWFCSMKQSD